AYQVGHVILHLSTVKSSCLPVCSGHRKVEALSSVNYTPYTRATIERAPQWSLMPEELREAVGVVSQVLPFRTNQYVLDELIDCRRVRDDPICRLNFPHRTMLAEDEYVAIRDHMAANDEVGLARTVRSIRERMNPHPAGQATHNVPTLDGAPV